MNSSPPLRLALVGGRLAGVPFALALVAFSVVAAGGQDHPAAALVTDAAITGPGSGWAIADRRILLTHDHGRTWRDATPAGLGQAPDPGVAFADERTGWVAGVATTPAGDARPQVWHTSDGGASWSATPLPLEAASVARVHLSAADGRHVWALAREPSSSNFSYGHLLRSRDAGRTWERLPAPPIADEVVFFDQTSGWLTGGPAGDEVYVTGDGGATWSERTAGLRSQIDGPDAGRISPPVATADGGRLLIVSHSEALGSVARFVRADAPARQWTQTGPPFLARYERPESRSRRDPAAEVSAALRDLLSNAPSGAWRGSSVALTSRVTAASISVRSAGIAWIVAREASCAAFKRGCVETSRLLVTQNGGTSIVDVTPARLSGDVASRPSEVAISQNKGFDKCTAAPLGELQRWWDESPYRDVNIYIGGNSRGCSQPQLNAEWVRRAWDQGWRLIPTWVGYQAPCTSCSRCANRFSLDPETARAQGAEEADRASDTAIGLGLLPRTVVYFDLEAYNSTDTACRQAASAFIGGWTRRMRERGNVAGAYGSATNAWQDWSGIADRPDAVWIGKWDLRETVWGLTPLPDSVWSEQQRLHQYRGGHDETWGGVTFNIDNDIEEGPVAAPAGAAAPDTSGPELIVESPREAETVNGPEVTARGMTSDAGRGDSGVAGVTVNGEPAEGGHAPGNAVASWRRTLTLPAGDHRLVVRATDASAAQNVTEFALTVRVVVTPGPPPEPAPPPPPPRPTTPETIVEGLTDPRGVVVFADRVYWLEPTRAGSTPLAGGETTVWPWTLERAGAIAVDGERVYVADARGIWRWPRVNAADPQLVVSGPGPVSSLAISGGHLFWTDTLAGTVMRAAVDGAQASVVFTGTVNPTGLIVTDDRLFWTELTWPGRVLSVSPDGNDSRIVGEGTNTPALALAAGHAFWGEWQQQGQGAVGRLRRAPLADGQAVTIVDEAGRPWSLASVNGLVFWADARPDGRVWQATLDGTEAVTLAAGLNEPTMLATDGSALVWLDRGSGEKGASRLFRLWLPVPAPTHPGPVNLAGAQRNGPGA